MLLCSSDLGHCPTVFITPLCSLPPVSMGVPSHPEVIRNTDFMLNKVGLGNREIVGLRTKKQQLTCNREMRQIGMKKPQFTFVMKIDNNSLLYHHRLHYKDKDKDEWLIAVEASQTENYNLSRDLKSFLFHATDKNLTCEFEVFAWFSIICHGCLREIQWMVEPIVQKVTVLSAVLYYKRNSYQCPGDIIRFCNNAFRHCNDHLRNIGILVGGSTSMRLTNLKKQFAWMDLYDPAEEECYWMAVDRLVSPTLQ
ncbi:hypothetical protein V6N13_032916 [Hibiscus sabdariffa]